MAIKVNGKLVAGLGKSAYEQAQEGGYTGTEEEFISALANIGSNPTAEGLPVNDVRTGTVRDGQSIAAGDVVNVRSLGKTVAIQWNGEPTLFRVVQVGNPDPSIYDASCDGIWVMAVDYLTRMITGLNNDYKASNAHTWCNGDFIDGFETELQEKIKMVKIPYWDGTGTEGSLKNGAEGLSTKGFLPSLDEFGYPQSEARSMGHMLSAFKSGKPPVTKGNYFLCRNPTSTNTTEIFGFLTNNPSSKFTPKATQEANFTPCFILPLDTDLSTIGTVVEDNYDVYRDFVAQKNVENRLNTVVMTGSDLFKLNESYSILIGNSSSNPAAYLIDNTTGKSVYSVSAYSSAVLSISGDRLDDTHFVVAFESNSISRWSVYQVTGTTITLADGTRSLGDNSTNPVVVTLSTSNFAVTHNSNGRLRLTVGSYPFTSSTANELNSVNPAHISATRIPDDDSGNKRVCICFSDTGDGNKGKAVIATVDSANAVTFGDVVTFNEASTTDIHCTYSLDGWVYVLFIDSATQMIAFNPELLTEKTEKKQIAGSIPNLVEICAVGHSVVGIYSSYAQTIYRTGNVLNIGAQYNWNNSYQGLFPSASITENNRFIIAYADGGNSSYGITTILEISGNRIAGSFLNNSKDAIALESGEGGDTIKLGFGGYCACEGITAGQTIDSEGVTAYSPLDGWLEIKDPWARGYVTGEYTGNNAAVFNIDLGFKPAAIVIADVSYNFTISMVCFRGCSQLNYMNETTLKSAGITWNDAGVSLSDAASLNSNNYKYRYIAWR